MITVKILKDTIGVVSGEVYPRHFKAGEVYSIDDNLLACFIQEGAVELVTVESPDEIESDDKPEIENKVIKRRKK